MAELDVEIGEESGYAVVTVSGEVDVSNASRLRDGLDRVLATGRSQLVVDLQQVGFMDSTGLGVLVGRLRVVRARRGSMRLVCSEPRLLRVLSITHLDTVCPLHDSVEEAVAAFTARPGNRTS